jgi:hypothetical protein
MHVEYQNHRSPYYICMKVFCPYQAVQVETTHMKNCSLIPAQLVLIVLITLTKGEKQKIKSVKAHLPVVMHIRHGPSRHVQDHSVTQHGPLFHLTLTCLLGRHGDGQSPNLFIGPP